MKVINFIILALVFVIYSTPGRTQDSDTVTQYDLNIIEYGDPYSFDSVLKKIKLIYTKHGKDAILQVMPSMIKRAQVILRDNKRLYNEPESEQFGDIIWVLSVSEDKRILPLFMEITASKVSSWDVAKGLLKVGKFSFKSISDSLESKSAWTVMKNSFLLKKMYEYDDNHKHFDDNMINTVRVKMEELLKSENNSIRIEAVRSLDLFGNEKSIPFLNQMIIGEKDSLIKKEAEKAKEIISKK
jgi:hypothetical protein